MVKSQGIQPGFYLWVLILPLLVTNYRTRGHYLTSVCMPMSAPVNGDSNSSFLIGFLKRLKEGVCGCVCILEQWLVENITYVFAIFGENGSHDNSSNN